MTLDELIEKLLRLWLEEPTQGSLEVAIEGCDCWGDVHDVDFNPSLNAIAIYRDEEFKRPQALPAPTRVSGPLPIRPKRLPGLREIE